MEASGRGLIHGTIPEFTYTDWEKLWKNCWSVRYLNPGPPKTQNWLVKLSFVSYVLVFLWDHQKQRKKWFVSVRYTLFLTADGVGIRK
jgi:hypothetical protein